MEQVLVIKNELLECYIPEDKQFVFLSDSRKEEIYQSAIEHNEFLDRDFAETDYTSRQVIPYAVIRYENDIFVLERKSKQSEKRLHNKLSIGIGGHLNPVDSTSNDIILECLRRELNEEIAIKGAYSTEFIGVIIDNSTDVSRVHVGFAFEIIVEAKNVSVEETDKMDGGWISLIEIPEHLERMETWSQIVLKNYYL